MSMTSEELRFTNRVAISTNAIIAKLRNCSFVEMIILPSPSVGFLSSHTLMELKIMRLAKPKRIMSKVILLSLYTNYDTAFLS